MLHMREVGRAGSFAKSVGEDGAVDWGKFGCYIVDWSDLAKPAVAHRPTDTRKPMVRSLNFTKEWKLDNNANDIRSRAYHAAGGEYYLHELFKATADGPYVHKIKRITIA